MKRQVANLITILMVCCVGCSSNQPQTPDTGTQLLADLGKLFDIKPPKPEKKLPVTDKTVASSDGQGLITTVGSFDTFIPSSGAPGQGVAVRVFHPAQSKMRYSSGAPIVVYSIGGWDGGGLTPSGTNTNVEKYGYIFIEYLYPGGKASDGTKSSGTYDWRGDYCMQVTRDVVLYAMGKLADQNGKKITDRLSYALTSEVGMYGSSNGGNMVLGTMGKYGSSIPSVKWFLAWESPIGDQYANGELNENPYYVHGTCTPSGCPMNGLAAALKWDAAGQSSTAKTAGMTSTTYTGLIYAKSNTPSIPDKKFDMYPTEPGASPTDYKLYPSGDLAETLRSVESTLFPGGIAPTWLVIDATKNAAYWKYRDGNNSIPAAHSTVTNLFVMHLGTVVDHVQTQPDYPHNRNHVQAWIDAGHKWARLNPDSKYMELVTGNAASNFPDNDANKSVSYPGTKSAMVPESVGGTPLGDAVIIAGILELCDRAHDNNTSVNLSATLH